MRLWVRSEYAAELAVVFAWLTALIPWNVTHSDLGSTGAVLFIRWPLFQIRYTFGVPLADAVKIDYAYGALRYQSGQSMALPYQAWVVAAAVFAVALLLSIAMYTQEDRLDMELAVSVMGGLLVLSGLVFAVATYLLSQHGFPGVPIPVGVPFALVFGGILLQMYRA